MRKFECCCRCSLRPSILILLWLDLISQVLWVIRFAIIAAQLMPHLDVKVIYSELAVLGWSCIILATTIYGIVGVEQHRPSYLLPYIGRHLFTLVIFTIGTLGAVGYILVGDRIIVVIRGQKSNEYIRLTYHSVICAMIVNLVLFWPLVFYFFCVIWRYYRATESDRLPLYV